MVVGSAGGTWVGGGGGGVGREQRVWEERGRKKGQIGCVCGLLGGGAKVVLLGRKVVVFGSCCLRATVCRTMTRQHLVLIVVYCFLGGFQTPGFLISLICCYLDL